MVEKEFQDAENKNIEEGGTKNNTINISSGFLSEEKEKEIELVIRNSAKQISTDLKNGRTDKVVKNFIQPLPKALLLFLPFIAFACKIIYIGRGKYYVEHLIYLLHNHSFLFAVVILTIVTVQLTELYPGFNYPLAILINLFFIFYAAEYFINKIKQNYPEKKIRSILQGFILTAIIYGIYQFTKSESIGASFTLLWAFYVPYYLYRSMRKVYKSSRVVTIMSYSMIALAYFVLFMLMLVIYIVYSGYTYS